MCHENQRCAGQVQMLQNVSLAVELKRRIAVLSTDRKISGESWHRAVVVTLQLVDMWIDELAPDYRQCDNPPVE